MLNAFGRVLAAAVGLAARGAGADKALAGRAAPLSDSRGCTTVESVDVVAEVAAAIGPASGAAATARAGVTTAAAGSCGRSMDAGAAPGAAVNNGNVPAGAATAAAGVEAVPVERLLMALTRLHEINKSSKRPALSPAMRRRVDSVKCFSPKFYRFKPPATIAVV